MVDGGGVERVGMDRLLLNQHGQQLAYEYAAVERVDQSRMLNDALLELSLCIQSREILACVDKLQPIQKSMSQVRLRSATRVNEHEVAFVDINENDEPLV